METFMLGLASLEIFLASVGIATAAAWLSLCGAFWLMQDAGAPRQIALRPRTATGGMAYARVHASGKGSQLSRIR